MAGISRYGVLVADGGANDVLKVNPWTGKVSTFFVPPTVKDVAACLQPGAQNNPGTVGCDPVPTGIAVTRSGTIYVSEVLHGAPEGDGPPPPGFDPSSVGRITRIGCHGHVSHAQVTMPVGLSLSGGRLYSTAWSIAGQLGIPSAGQIVQVRPWAFH